MFSEASVILFTGGLCSHAEVSAPRGRVGTSLDWHLVVATAAVGMHPTGMQSCEDINLIYAMSCEGNGHY